MNTHDLREVMDELAQDVPDSDFGADDAWRLAQRTRHRRRWSVTAAAAAAVVAVGSGTWLARTLASDDQFLNEGGESLPFTTYHGREDYAPLVGYRGPVTFQDGCIRFGNLPLLLPDDTAWDPERQVLSLDGHTLRVGEEIVHGGGPVDADRADRIPADCRDERFAETKELFQMGSLEHSTPSN